MFTSGHDNFQHNKLPLPEETSITEGWQSQGVARALPRCWWESKCITTLEERLAVAYETKHTPAL